LTKIILVRHGETDWNKVHRLQGGGSDTPLNETGKKQAARLAARLQSENFQAVYSSPLQRAVHTAEAIAGPHRLIVKIEKGLREIDLGNLEGFPSAQFPERFDRYVALNKHLAQNERGCESIKDLQDRAWQSINLIAAGNSGGVILAVSHYFVIVSLVCRVLNLPLEHLDRLNLSQGTLTSITLDTGGFTSLDFFNLPAWFPD
jgi:broad specificity phosphatase PhoE